MWTGGDPLKSVQAHAEAGSEMARKRSLRALPCFRDEQSDEVPSANGLAC
jgi:hypothetical protein